MKSLLFLINKKIVKDQITNWLLRASKFVDTRLNNNEDRPLANSKKEYIMATVRKKKVATKRVTASTKKTAKKVTKKTTTKVVIPTGFKVNYDGFNSKIFLQSLKTPGKMPRNVHPTLTAAKKDIVTKIKADAKKAIDRVTGLKTAKSEPGKGPTKPRVSAKTVKTPKKVSTSK